jgi:hypothetical protein
MRALIDSDVGHALQQRLRRPFVNLERINRLEPGTTVLIHVGKCGGTTLKKAIRATEWNGAFAGVHVRRPPVRRDLKYYILVRNPVRRAISAFSWRYRLVVEEDGQRGRFPGEYEALKKFGTLNSLAESLYSAGGAADIAAHREIRKIHHLREDIDFYLGDLLRFVEPGQIVEVLTQETLNDDILRIFNYENRLREKHNAAKPEDAAPETGALSGVAERNLRYFFRRDYDCLMRLYCMGKISKEAFAKLV